MRGGEGPATLCAGLILVLAGCTFGQQQASSSPDVTPSSTATATPSTAPPPVLTTPPVVSTPPDTTPGGAKLAITNLPFHNGEVGIFYLAVHLDASGGAPPYQWSVSAGKFPPGLSLSSGGTVTGKNSTSGHFNFTVKVKDSASATTSASTGLSVFSALSVKQPCANQCNVEQGCSVCGQFGAVSGGLPPYHYAVSAGSVPTGMGRSGLSLTGRFPASALGSEFIQVTVTDVFNASRQVNGYWYVFPHIDFATTSATCSGSFLSSCTTQLAYANGTPGVNPKVHIAADPEFGLPGGLSVTVGGGVVTVKVLADCGGGPGGCQGGYNGVLTLTLTDPGPCALSGPSNSALVTVSIRSE
jgi:large repetitive protein